MGGFDDSSIKSFFIIEAQEYLANFKDALGVLTSDASNQAAIDNIQKTAHTLKGSAGMLRFNNLSELSRYLELLMKAITQQAIKKDSQTKQILLHMYSIMEQMIENISNEKEDLNRELLTQNKPIFDDILEDFMKTREDSSIETSEENEDDYFEQALAEERDQQFEEETYEEPEPEETSFTAPIVEDEDPRYQETVITPPSVDKFAELESAAEEESDVAEDVEISQVNKVFDYSYNVQSSVPTLSSERKADNEETDDEPSSLSSDEIDDISEAMESPAVSEDEIPEMPPIDLPDAVDKTESSAEPDKPEKPVDPLVFPPSDKAEEEPAEEIAAEPEPETAKRTTGPEPIIDETIFPKSRSPREGDFFLPTSETTTLQPKEKTDRGMSFLDMIPDIKESFLLEATDHIQNMDHLLLDWESDYKNTELTTSLMRSAHSLKGSANTVGFPEMGLIAHKMEDIIEQVRDGKLGVSLELVDILFEGLDTMKQLLKWIDGEEMDAASLTEEVAGKLEKVLTGEIAPAAEEEKQDTAGQEIPETEQTAGGTAEQPVISPIEEEIESSQLLAEAKKKLEEAEPQTPVVVPVITDEYEQVRTTTGSLPALSEEDLAKGGGGLKRLGIGETEKQIVRVHINQLDTLMNLIGELVINRSKLDKRVDIFKNVSEELDFSRSRLLDSISEFSEKYEFTLPDMGATGDEGLDEFSALEFDKYDDFNILSRSLVEIGSDIVEIMNEMASFLSSFDTEIGDLAQAISRLQEEITRTRMVPVGRLFRRFTRTVRDISNRERKNVQLMVMGEDTELDKTVIEEVSDPLMHLIRNAVSHGIETPPERTAAGKNKQGTVLLNAYPEGNAIVIEVEDDGKGLSIQKIRETAIEKGLLTEEEAESVPQSMIIDYIFTPGFTTTTTTTDISGRGVGLDVVRENILNLGGTISVQTEKNMGTRFIIKLPLTLAITQALMVEVSGNLFALPLNAVEETIVLDSMKLGDLSKLEMIEVREKQIPFLKLHDILNINRRTNGRRFVPAVILGSAGTNVALLVDELLGQEEIVVKRLGEFLSGVRYFSGATISGDGQVVLILDPTHMVGLEEFAISSSPTMESTLKERLSTDEGPDEEEVEDDKTRLLLVDDSISIRKFVGKLLQNAGYNVDLAVDGLEALSKVETMRYDLIVTDLEMPRMHGYEFIGELKRDDRLKGIPIIVLTSRAGEKHKRKAMSRGADGYVVKPFNEEILLDKISKLL